MDIRPSPGDPNTTRRAVCAGIVVSSMILGAMAASPAAHPRPSSRASQTESPRPPAKPALWRGPGSCSASACHGAITPAATLGVLGNEHTTWISDDKHARAYEVLSGQRSVEIERRLARGDTPLDATRDTRCLACHSTPLEGVEKDRPPFDTEGVSCEACHGAAGDWIAQHTTAIWREFGSDRKAEHGFNDLNQLGVRVAVCAGCHVGSPADGSLPVRDVNHDLIAAGHPRLTFEYAAYQDSMPKHWNHPVASGPGHRRYDDQSSDFATRSWLTGQLGAARASLELLADRASDPKRPWPEFSEYSCFACHHGLKDDAWRRNGAKQQLWNWSPWAFAFRSEWQQDPSDDAQLSDLVKLMGSPAPDRAIVAKQARLYANHLAQVVTQTEQTPLNFPRVSELLRSLNAAAAWQGDRSWDQSAQRYLALVALLQTWRKMETGQSAQQADFERALDHRKAQLVFPAGFDSPRDFVPGSLQTVPER